MSDRLNKTSICSIVFLDMLEYSKKSVSEQIAEKTLFNSLVAEALKDVAQSDRIILDTGDGVAVALMGEPEEALFVSLTIRDAILNNNKTSKSPISIRTGINLGSVRVVKDLNGQLNILGDGINVAQRIMTFAEPNQIMVSRSYYEVTSRLTQEFNSMFTYSGVRQDKHVRDHEVYLIKPSATAPNPDVPPINSQTKPASDTQQASSSMSAKAASFTSAAKDNIKALSSSATLFVFMRKYLLWLLPILAIGIVWYAYNKKTQMQQNQVFTLEVIKSMDKSKAVPDIPLDTQVSVNAAETKPSANQLGITKTEEKTIVQSKAVPDSTVNAPVPVISLEPEPSSNELALTKAEEKTIVQSKHVKKQKIAKKVEITFPEHQQLSENKVKVPELKVAEHKPLEHKPEVKKLPIPSHVSVVADKNCTQGQNVLSPCK